MKEGSLMRPALVLTSGKVAAFAASFCIPVVLARLLSTADFGVYKQIFLVYTTVYLIAQLGMAESLFYFVPADPGGAGRYVANAMLVLGICGAAAGGALFAMSPDVARWLGSPALLAHLPLLGLFLALTMTSAGLEIVLTARGRHLGAAAAYAASDIVKAACLIVPAVILGGIQGLLLGAVLFALLRLLSTLAIYRHEFRSTLRPGLPTLAAQLAYTLPMGLYVLVEVAQANVHQYAVSARVDAATFAIYAVGCLQIPLVEFIASPTCNVMMVGMRERLRSGERGPALQIWRHMTGRLALILFPVVAVLLLSGSDLIRFLFTERYAESVPIFSIWTWSLGFAVFQTDGVLRVFAETRLLLLIGVLKFVLILSSVGWFLATLGLRGPVLLMLFTMLAGKTLGLARIRQLLGADLGGLLPWRSLALAAAGSAVAAGTAAVIPAALLRDHVDLSPLPRMLVTCSVFAVLYATFLVVVSSPQRARRLIPGWLLR